MTALSIYSRHLFAALILLATPAAQAAEPLAWKLESGLTNRYRMTQDTKVEKTGAGGDATVQSSLTIDMSWTVQKVNEDGSAVLDQRIDRMQMKAFTSDGQTAEIDSAAKDDPQGPGAMLAPFLKAMTEHPFTVTMTPRGEIKDVKIPDAIVEALKNQPGAAQMGDLASEEGFKKLVAQAAFVLPEKFAPGVQWTSKTETNLPAVGKQTAETTYRYEGPKEVDGQKLEAFSAKVDLKFTVGQVPVEVAKQESEAEILFDREAGRLKSSSIKQNTALKITVGNQTINQTIDQTIKMKWLPEKE
jgi:hypothetical protein